VQADALQFARAHQCLAIVSSQAVSACVGRAAVGLRVRAPEVKCALVACVSSCVLLGDVARVVCFAAIAPHSSMLARGVFSHCAARALQCLCAWRPSLILRGVFFTGTLSLALSRATSGLGLCTAGG